MDSKPHPFAQQARKYSEDAKRKLLANLDIELADRIRRFEHALSDVLARFRSHQESQIVRIPKAVRSITMREFGDRYNGDVQSCLQGLQRRMQGDEPESITPAVRKRKWQESNETTDSGRQTKTARTTPSPSKTLPRGNGSTPRTQVRRPLHPHSQANQQRLNSPVKAHPLSNQLKAPSSASFNPEIYNAPAYPIARPPGGDPSTGHSAPNLNATRGESNILVKKGSLAAPLLKSFHPRGTNPAAKSGELTTESAGIIIVPTNDGRVLRIDPFTTTPAVIDSWTEVSDEAKKAAKEEAVAIISSQMAKWTIGT